MENNNKYKEVYKNLFANLDYYNSDLGCYNYKYVINELNKINKFNSILDVGTGRGNLIKLISKQYPEIKISTSDIEDFHHMEFPFHKIDLTDVGTLKDIEKHDIVTCTDVLEHLPESVIKDVIEILSKKCKIAIFTIANHSEIINGVQLHLIQKDLDFWKKTLKDFFEIKNSETYYNGRLYLLTCNS